ncbi:MAG: amidase family protein, partial [Gemmatimonadales bacterium]
WTEASRGRVIPTYTDYLDAHALRGARLGVMRQWSNRGGADEEVLERFSQALAAMERAGATIVDSVMIPEMNEIRRSGGLWCRRFQWDINAYLVSRGPDAPVKTLDEIVESRRTHPSIRQRLEFFQGYPGDPDEDEACITARENQETFRAAIRRQLEQHDLHAMVYPTWSNPPRLIGDLTTPAGDNSQDLAPGSGFPAITVPMGYVRGTLPVGLQFFGDAWSEPTLIALAYSYEQATMHRRAPETTPALGRR